MRGVTGVFRPHFALVFVCMCLAGCAARPLPSVPAPSPGLSATASATPPAVRLGEVRDCPATWMRLSERQSGMGGRTLARRGTHYLDVTVLVPAGPRGLVDAGDVGTPYLVVDGSRLDRVDGGNSRSPVTSPEVEVVSEFEVPDGARSLSLRVPVGESAASEVTLKVR